jgi:hypothetical protein
MTELHWEKNAWGEEGCDLYYGGLYVGSIKEYDRHRKHTKLIVDSWAAWFMSDDVGESLGVFKSFESAQKALVSKFKQATMG